VSFEVVPGSDQDNELQRDLKDPKIGIPVKDRRHLVRKYAQCFVGKEFVDWIMVRMPTMKKREEAVAYGNSLLERGAPSIPFLPFLLF